MAESLVAMLIIVPVVLVIYGLGKYLDIKDMSFQASRYSAWQTTVGDNSAEIVKTTKERFFMSPYAGFEENAGNSISWKENSKLDGDRWGRIKSHRNIALASEESENLVDRDNLQLYKTESSLDQEVWGKGLREVESDAVGNSLFDEVVSSIQHVKLGVNSDGYVESKVEVPLGKSYLLNGNDPRASNQIAMSTSLALVSDPWVPSNEAAFKDRVDDMVLLDGNAMRISEPLSVIGRLVPDSWDAFTDIKGVAESDYEMASQRQSEILPCNRLRDEDARQSCENN